VIGIGTQDDLEYAKEFVSTLKITIPMFWDESFKSWQALEITAQPAAVLFTADGKKLGSWLGRIPEDEVLSLIAS
jgi:hypothetical protein